MSRADEADFAPFAFPFEGKVAQRVSARAVTDEVATLPPVPCTDSSETVTSTSSAPVCALGHLPLKGKAWAIKNHRSCERWFYMSSIVTLVLVLASGLGFLTALDAGALVVLLLSEVGQNAGLRAAALESLQSVVQRLILLDVDFRHVFPSLQIRLAAL